MKNAIIWDVTPCGSYKNQCFGGTSVLTIVTRRNIPEDSILQEKYHQVVEEELGFYITRKVFNHTKPRGYYAYHRV
jgi:hypothetical protein